MSISMMGVFQTLINGRWVDVKDDADVLWNRYVRAWLGESQNSWYNDFDFIEPVAADRGLPDDFSMRDSKWHCESGNHDDLMYIGDYERSWVLASEILSSMPGIVTCRGQMLLEHFEQWDGHSEPNASSTAPSHPVGTHIAIDEETTVVVVQWRVEGKDLVADFVGHVRSLVEKYGPDVRYVYGFS